jgi:hypothetical protein
MNNKKFKEPLAAQFRPTIADLNIAAVVIFDMTSDSAWFRVHRRVRVLLYRIINAQVHQAISHGVIKQ